MPNSKELFDDLVRQITLDETRDEIHSIVYLIFDHYFGLTKTGILAEKQMGNANVAVLNEVVIRINQHEPVQYILGEADFYGRNFIVNPAVLIPRPETEMIIDELRHWLGQAGAGFVLDVGTGSGCIAITAAKEFPYLKISALDISERALEVAAANAIRHDAQIDFHQRNILEGPFSKRHFDFILSNPPYITPYEKNKMSRNVVDFEPHLALFVPEDNPLLFYKAIATIGKSMLTASGKIITEINEHFGEGTAAVFRDAGYNDVIVKRDSSGKDRVIVASV